MHQLITDPIRAELLANGTRRDLGETSDPYPVVKLFTPDAGATWLLSEIDPHDPDLAFGLCDLGIGCPELGYVRISELKALRGHLRLPVERDGPFHASGPLSAYARAARRAQRIVTDPAAIRAARDQAG